MVIHCGDIGVPIMVQMRNLFNNISYRVDPSKILEIKMSHSLYHTRWYKEVMEDRTIDAMGALRNFRGIPIRDVFGMQNDTIEFVIKEEAPSLRAWGSNYDSFSSYHDSAAREHHDRMVVRAAEERMRYNERIREHLSIKRPVNWATDSKTDVMELATQAEVNEGTDSVKKTGLSFMKPKKFDLKC